MRGWSPGDGRRAAGLARGHLLGAREEAVERIDVQLALDRGPAEPKLGRRRGGGALPVVIRRRRQCHPGQVRSSIVVAPPFLVTSDALDPDTGLSLEKGSKSAHLGRPAIDRRPGADPGAGDAGPPQVGRIRRLKLALVTSANET